MKRNFTHLTLLCVAILTLAACSKDNTNNVFDDSPTARVADKNSDLQKALLSQPNGFKAEYFTKDDEYGGFTFFMQFHDDGIVNMTSDFDADYNIESSSYDVRLGATTEMIFTTRNHIHKVSNPSAPGLVGKGYKGTSVFQLFKISNDSLYFKDVRNKDIASLILTPAGFTNFNTESIESAKVSRNNRIDFVSSEEVTAFPFLSINDGTKTTLYDLNYDYTKIFATPKRTNDDGTVSDTHFGMLFTDIGLIISPAINVNGTLISVFTKSADGLQYEATVNGVTAIIGYGNTPATPLTPYDFGVRRPTGYNNSDEPGKSSIAFHTFYKEFTDMLYDNYGAEVFWYGMFNLNNGNQPYLYFNTSVGNLWWEFNFNVENGIVTFELNGNTNANQFTQDVFQPLIDELILGPSGYYIKDAGNYLNYSNRTFTLINVDKPNMFMNYWDCCG